jgi:transposase-like protein
MYKGRSRQDWLTLVESWRSSGLSVANFAKANHCNQHSLRYWIASASKRSKSISGAPPAFVKLKVPAQAETQSEPKVSQLVRLHLAKNLALELDEKVESPTLLAAIILISGLMR